MSQDSDLTLLALKNLTQMIREAAVDAYFDTLRLRHKYNPNQPRAPRGTSDGGQWISDGFGGGSSYGGSRGGRFGLGKPPKNPFLHPAMSNNLPDKDTLDLLEGGGSGRLGPVGGGGGRSLFTRPSVPKSPQANRAVGKIQKLNRQGADDLEEVFKTRATGKTSPKESNAHIRKAVDDVEEFLGGKVRPEDIKKSENFVIQKGDKKFRMDIRNTGWKKGTKTKDDPHFHFEQWDGKKWIDATDEHKNYFLKE